MKKFGGMTDEELALLYIGGNNRAFDELLSRNQDKLFNYIMFVVRDQELANDIFQDTFVKVITRLQEGRYAVTGKFSFWITRIAHNVIMDWYRQQRGERMVDLGEERDLASLHAAASGGREVEMVNEQVLFDVRRMMDSLPTPQREVVFMRFYQELSFKEIAEITGVSINTALGRMRYAIINLRRMAREHNIALSLAV
jgi:RNA polymerase sigma factor (sigma-70 family)